MNERELFGTFCRDTPRLRQRLSESRRRLLDAKLAGLRDGTVSFVEVLRAIGYPTAGGQRDAVPGQPYAPLPGALPGLPPGEYVCPGRVCGRAEPRGADGVVPECAVYGIPLRRGADR